jgi:hypothetical protein
VNLVDELRAATADPPPTRIDLDGLMAAGRHRMVRRRWVATACTAVLTITASVGVTRLASPPDRDNAPVTTKIPDFTHLMPPERVWPDAIRHLPTKLPDGRGYRLAAALDDGTYLVRAEPDTESTDLDGPIVYDPDRATVRHLLDPKLLDGMTEGIGSGLPVKRVGDEAVWLLSGARGEKAVWEFWAAPLDGGAPARRLVSLTDGNGGGLPMVSFDATDDAVYWSVPGPEGKPTGIMVLSLSGGAPRYVPGYDLTGLDGWVSTAKVTADPNPQGLPATEPPRARSGELWNLATGERLGWRANQALDSLVCDPTACYGPTKEGKDGWVTHGLDGSGLQRLGATIRGVSGSAFNGGIAVGTISTVPPGRRERGLTETRVIWDRSTGKAASHSVSMITSTVAGTAERPLYTWSDGDVRYVLDLSVIR